MEHYKIMITPDAEKDLKMLRNYIANVLMMLETASEYVKMLRANINTLSEMPGRIKTISKEPWHSRGIRKLIIKNFYVYYRIDQEKNVVYIMNVIYDKRDQLHALSDMKDEPEK